MRFVSKSTNLNVILRPSLPSNPMTGTPATPGLFVRFIDGIADVKNEDMVKMLLAHPGFNQDFIAVEENARDPYAHNRAESEPGHVLTEMQFGQPVARKESGKQKLPPEVMKLVQEYAADLVKEMLPEAVAATLKAHADRVEAEKPTPAPVEEPVAAAPEAPKAPKKTTKAAPEEA